MATKPLEIGPDPYSLDDLLNAARDNAEEVRIGEAFNLGLKDGAKFQQGRCKSGCRFWNGLDAKPDYDEMRSRYWPIEEDRWYSQRHSDSPKKKTASNRP